MGLEKYEERKTSLPKNAVEAEGQKGKEVREEAEEEVL